jgi:hypothetical protein
MLCAPLPVTPPPLSQGLFLALLVAGTLAVAAVALGAGVWARRRCGQEDSGEPPGTARGVRVSTGAAAPMRRRRELQVLGKDAAHSTAGLLQGMRVGCEAWGGER